MAGHVTSLATKLENPMPIRFWFMSYNVSHWLALKMRTRRLRMRQITWPVNRGSKYNYIFGIADPDLPIHYALCNFYWATTTIKGRSLSSVTNAKAIDCVNFLCVTLWNFDIKQFSYMAGHVTNLATKLENPMPIRSWFISYNVSLWLALEMRTRPLRMRRITWSVNRGSKIITYLESPTPICLFTMQLLLGYDDDYGSFTLERHQRSSVTNAKALDCVNFLCVTLWPWPLTFWLWTVLVHGGSRVQPSY